MFVPTFDQLLAIGAVVGIAIFIFVWIFLPFAVFGIKPLLRELITEMQTTRALLRKDPLL